MAETSEYLRSVDAALARLKSEGFAANWDGESGSGIFTGGKTTTATDPAIITDGFAVIRNNDSWVVRFLLDARISVFTDLDAAIEFVIARYQKPWKKEAD